MSVNMLNVCRMAIPYVHDDVGVLAILKETISDVNVV